MATNKVIKKLRKQTFLEAIDLLETYGRAAIIRPTSFGKTGILVKFFKLKKPNKKKTKRYKHILFLYPEKVIKETVLNFYFKSNIPENPFIPNVEFVTHSELRNLTESQMKTRFKNVDLIIADECHTLGGREIHMAVNKLISVCTNAHFLGTTATPERMDFVDVIQTFFNNITVSEFTIHDAFKCKALMKPYYCYCSYDVDADVEDVKTEAMLEINKLNTKDQEKAKQILQSRLIEMANIGKMENVIRKTCDQYAKETNYMKFIVYFRNFKHIEEKGPDVIDWFQKAYPTHTVNAMEINSKNEENSKNINNLSKLVYTDTTIDLIFCCEMLNMGYHVDDLTGICMFRGTKSSTIFTQQFGRALNANYSGIIFDWVDNVHRMSLYRTLFEESKAKRKAKNRYEALKAKIIHADPDNNSGIRNTDDDSFLLDPFIIDPTTAAPGLTPKETREFKQLNDRFSEKQKWQNRNEINPMDMIVTDHEASYREYIAKIIGEPVAMRCNQAWRLWIEAGGDDSVMTKSAILSQQAPQYVPLAPYADLKRVTAEMVLDAMGITD